MLKPLLGALAIYGLTLSPAYALLTVAIGNNPQIDDNVINNPACASNVVGPALLLKGCLNGSHATVVDISSDENIVYDAGGAAKVDAQNDEYSRLTIAVEGFNIGTLILNIGAASDGFVRFTDGTTTSGVFALDDNGQNFFTITGGPFPFISYTTFSNSAGTTESDIVDTTRQIRIGVAAVTPVPEPATLALLGMGLIGLGLARRRRAA